MPTTHIATTKVKIHHTSSVSVAMADGSLLGELQWHPPPPPLDSPFGRHRIIKTSSPSSARSWTSPFFSSFSSLWDYSSYKQNKKMIHYPFTESADVLFMVISITYTQDTWEEKKAENWVADIFRYRITWCHRDILVFKCWHAASFLI